MKRSPMIERIDAEDRAFARMAIATAILDAIAFVAIIFVVLFL